jgi:hypothetical protein
MYIHMYNPGTYICTTHVHTYVQSMYIHMYNPGTYICTTHVHTYVQPMYIHMYNPCTYICTTHVHTYVHMWVHETYKKRQIRHTPFCRECPCFRSNPENC